MAHSNTILGQFLALFPRHEFEKIRREVQPKVHARALSAWTQFVAMLSGQLTGRDSLRGMVDALAPQGRKLYHLGMGAVSRASLARANERTPALLFERVFAALLTRCQEVAPKTTKKFRFKDSGKVYLLDATLIELPLSLFSWAKPKRQGRGEAAHRAFGGRLSSRVCGHDRGPCSRDQACARPESAPWFLGGF